MPGSAIPATLIDPIVLVDLHLGCYPTIDKFLDCQIDQTVIALDQIHKGEFIGVADHRDKHTILVGGGPVTEGFCKKIQADGYGQTAQDGGEMANDFVRRRRGTKPTPDEKAGNFKWKTDHRQPVNRN